MRFVVVHETSDGREADLVGEVLREHGLDARVIGTRDGSLIGVGQHILSIRVEVPDHEQPRAADLVHDFLRSEIPNDASNDEDSEDVEESDSDSGALADDDTERSENPYGAPRRDLAVETSGRVRDPRKRIVAFAVSLIFPGGGTLYARHFAAGIVLGIAQLAAFFAMAGGRPFGVVYVLAKAADVVGAQVAVNAYNRGRPFPTAVQLVFAVGAVLVGGAIGEAR